MQGKRKQPLRNDSYAFFLLKQFYCLSTMWRQDANLYLNSFGDEYTNYRNYKKLLELGFIEEYKPLKIDDIKPEVSKTELFQKLDEPSKSGYAVVNITKAGINYLIDNSKEDESDYLLKFSEEVHSRFRTSNPKNYLKELYKSHVMMMMECAGAKTFPYEKPSLYHLYGVLTNAKSYNPAIDHSDRFMKYRFMSRDEIESIKANNGFFYTLDEFREFDKCLNGVFNKEISEEVRNYAAKFGKEAAAQKYKTSLENQPENLTISEEYKSSKCVGIFISDKRCLMVYLSEPSTNKLVYVDNTEQILKGKINTYFSRIMDYGNYKILLSGETRVSGIDGLVLCDGNSMIYSMATGKKSGRFKQREGDDLAKLYTPRSLLLHDNDLFANIYATPSTKTGIRSLNYLLCHSVKDYDMDCYKQVRDHSDLFTCEERRDDFFSYGYAKENDGRYEALPRPVIFMPVAEVNTLFQLSLRSAGDSDYYDRYAFITYPELVNAISHSIRKNSCLYYDVDDSIIYTRQIHHPDGSITDEDVSVKKRFYWNADRNRYQGFTNDEIQAIDKICLQNDLNDLGDYWTIPQLDSYMYYFYSQEKKNLNELCSENYSDADTKFSKPENVIEYDYFGHVISKEDSYDKRGKNLLEKKRTEHPELFDDDGKLLNHRRKTNFAMTMHTANKEIFDTIRRAASAKNQSVSEYALTIVYEQALNDIEERAEDTRQSVAAFRSRYSK